MALASPEPEAWLLHHWDPGRQFTSERSQAALREVGVEVSIGGHGSRTANCWDNAAMESFFATLTKQCLNPKHFRTRQEARTAIFESMECFYNPVRLHWTLHSQSPKAFEQAEKTSESYHEDELVSTLVFSIFSVQFHSNLPLEFSYEEGDGNKREEWFLHTPGEARLLSYYR